MTMTGSSLQISFPAYRLDCGGIESRCLSPLQKSLGVIPAEALAQAVLLDSHLRLSPQALGGEHAGMKYLAYGHLNPVALCFEGQEHKEFTLYPSRLS